MMSELTNFSTMIDGMYGGNQMKYSGITKFWKKREGCGFVAIANCYGYYKYKKSGYKTSYTETEFIKLMEEVYTHFDFEIGIFYENIFIDKCKSFAKKKNCNVNCTTRNFNSSDFYESIAISLKVNVSGALLSKGGGGNGKFNNHWVLVTGIDKIVKDKIITGYKLTISSWGEKYITELSDFGNYVGIVMVNFN